jgi:hypothetical protein
VTVVSRERRAASTSGRTAVGFAGELGERPELSSVRCRCDALLDELRSTSRDGRPTIREQQGALSIEAPADISSSRALR